MNIYKFFMNQFTYQMQNSTNTKTLTTLEEYKSCLAFTGLLTALPVVGFIIYLLFTGIAFRSGLSKYLPEYFLETSFLFFVFFPFIILLALTASYVSYLIRLFKYKQIFWALSILSIVLVNYIFYILCLIKIFSPPTP